MLRWRRSATWAGVRVVIAPPELARHPAYPARHALATDRHRRVPADRFVRRARARLDRLGLARVGGAGYNPRVPTHSSESYRKPNDTCLMCGKPVYRRPTKKTKTCSMVCRNLWYHQRDWGRTGQKSGAANPRWQEGRSTTADGYVRLRRPDHPHADSHGYVLEHRLVAERTLGRHLLPTEVVHHLNHVKGDNRPENLEVLPSHAAHRHRHFQDGSQGQRTDLGQWAPRSD